MISPYGRELAGKVGARLSTNPFQKLTPNLMNKTNYVVHYLNLQFYLETGMKLTKIHKVMEFDQSLWLKPCIDLNVSDDQKETLKHKEIELRRYNQNFWKTKKRLQELTQKLKELDKDRNRVKAEVMELRSEVARQISESDSQMSE